MSTDTDTAGTPEENRHGTGCSAFNRDECSDTADQPPATAQHHYGVRLVRLDFGAGTAVQVALPIGTRILHGYLAHEAGLVLARPGERPVGKLVLFEEIGAVA